MRLAGIAALLVVAACGEGGAGGGTEVVTRDSAGVSIVEHPAAAVDAVALARPGEPELMIGGLEAEGDHDATYLTRGWLQDDGLLVINQRESRFIRFDGQGAVLGTYGRRGDGPDEFQVMLPMRLTGDSLLLVDVMRSNSRILRSDLTSTAAVVFGNSPSFRFNFFGATPDGALLAIKRSEEMPTERSGPPSREVQHVVRLAAGSTAWDTLVPSPGELSYPTVFSEGGQEYPGRNLVTFGAYPYRATWGDRLVLVDNSDWGVAVHGPDGTLRQLIRLDLPRRPVTGELRDSVYLRDERQMKQFAAEAPPAMMEQFLAQSKSQQFADSVAPYDRILTTRDGLLWLRLNETPMDSTTTWFGFAREGHLVHRLELPIRWSLLDADGNRILIRRLDDDDIGYLEIRPMERTTP